MEPTRFLTNTRRGPAFSLVEILVVVAVIAIITGIFLPQILGVGSATEQTLARRNLNMLNAAVGAFNQSDRNLGELVSGSQADKEQAVLDYLRSTNEIIQGSPFLDPERGFAVSSSSGKYRARWNGRVFEWVDRGTAATGVDLE